VRSVPSGMAIERHEAMAQTLDRLQHELREMRSEVLAAFGSPSAPYVHLTRTLTTLDNLRHTLRRALLDEHSDRRPAVELVQIYNHHPEEV
jgi:hypothetical protein